MWSTIKGGFLYNLTENINAFINTGYISKAREFDYYYEGYTANFRKDDDNEKVKALEFGANYKISNLSVNLNTYLTNWENRPGKNLTGKKVNPNDNQLVDCEAFIPGIDAKHKGVELEIEYKPIEKLKFQGLASFGNWVWDKEIDVEWRTEEGGLLIEEYKIDVSGIHVGDAAQTQLGGSVRWEVIKNLYVMPKITYFDRYYAEFSVDNEDEKNMQDSWKLPSYYIIDLHMGYKWKMKSLNKTQFSIRANVLNLLDEIYISDAQNNDGYHPLFGQTVNNINIGNTYDGNSATVFFGAPRRFTLSFEVRF